MDARFLRLLPEPVVAIVREIETYSNGKQVEVLFDAKAGSPLCWVSPERALIIFPSETAVTPAGLVHEILHIERNWPQQVPQIIGAERSLNQFTGYVDNLLEHVVILPRQVAFGFGEMDKWTKAIQEDWETRMIWRGISDPFQRRSNLLLLFLGVDHLLPGTPQHQLAMEKLREEKVLEEAQRFSADVGRVKTSKEKMTGVVARYLKVERAIKLQRADLKSGKMVDVPIALDVEITPAPVKQKSAS
jgi:hypothetical protein